MKLTDGTHTTNYFDAFIEVAEDIKLDAAKIPEEKNGKKTIASMQFDMLSKKPYKYTSDEVLFQIHADRNDLTKAEYEEARAQLFSKGQACFRASPLTKQYGFGVHFDHKGRMALYGMETKEYQQLLKDKSIQKVKAMRSARK
ncbi:DUF6157 family protein [Cytophaga aurantiaca]|uniref:DUF6157 family protein n=1 Tax=Cytophaga aurantiaca TaxID=29530 RepID=UPI00036AAD95|nr:DUF6157 family protein [Cytophaga aurantiaca]